MFNARPLEWFVRSLGCPVCHFTAARESRGQSTCYHPCLRSVPSPIPTTKHSNGQVHGRGWRQVIEETFEHEDNLQVSGGLGAMRVILNFCIRFMRNHAQSVRSTVDRS
jgi:hypothetical protein